MTGAPLDVERAADLLSQEGWVELPERLRQIASRLRDKSGAPQPNRLTLDEIRAINTAAANLDIGLALTPDERRTLAYKLFAIAGNPMPDGSPR